MPFQKIAEYLTAAKTSRERDKILVRTKREDHLAIAHELKKICYEVWSYEPAKARKTALALQNLARLNADREIAALAFWVAGIAELTRGKLERSIENLDQSAAVFRRIKKENEAANTQVAKLIVLGLLGKYDEAVKTGKSALKIFEKYGDELAAGKIEMNLSNIAARRDHHREAEKYCLSALRRFQKTGEKSWETMAQNGLANTYSELNDFRLAEKFYRRALENARLEKMFMTEAEIEASMGNLALFRGKFDEALRLLELSRRKYDALKMPHQKAIAELEIAGIYAELNLTDEARAIYEKAVKAFQKLKLQGEEARARAGFGKNELLRGDFKRAKIELRKSQNLYLAEKNPNGAAGVKLIEADLEIARARYGNALKIIREAEKILAKSENPRLKLIARFLRGEILRLSGKSKAAEKILSETYAESLKNEQRNLARICLNSLGELFLKADRKRAESCFLEAVKMIETLRAPLPAEEFRMAFLANKLAPFENLAKIYLAGNELEKALTIIENARARTLFESLEGASLADEKQFFSQPDKDLADAREELNWLYSRQNRGETGDFETWQKEIKRREKRIGELLRRRDSAGKKSVRRQNGANFNFSLLQKSLGKNRVLIEFVKFGDKISAFAVSRRECEFFADLADEREIISLLESLHFQFGALRYGAAIPANFSGELKKRADFYLQKLYEKLFAPLADFTGESELLIVPVGAVHYVPFHALKAENYLIETREITYAPSAAVWDFLQKKRDRKIENALLIGFADEKIPLVEREIESLQRIFDDAKILRGADASFSNYKAFAPGFDVLHLACHGQFRPDNPLFSSLHLADGFITVRDICTQQLKSEIVTLSACETGLNNVFAGDELLGLTRGFLAAGAKSLVLSLWTVNDQATARLMKIFYQNLQRGERVSASLRIAQLEFIKENAHPYFWSPFAVVGK